MGGGLHVRQWAVSVGMNRFIRRYRGDGGISGLFGACFAQRRRFCVMTRASLRAVLAVHGVKRAAMNDAHGDRKHICPLNRDWRWW